MTEEEFIKRSKEYEAFLKVMFKLAEARGFKVMTCKYNNLFIPVLQDIADQYELVEGQDLTDQQMIVLTEAMALFMSQWMGDSGPH